ncbi:hypothetical protein GCM10010404_28790 [Nonomuraea africana]|uniref:Terpene synthase n=1 Tax=Nonomuraea africana TaxID=46171 RepID=A0ABR9KEZ7_9ACTN|nr:hypothetical protein [Nonomuraea africana]MBE1560597.1 hypothetical protein [Nonomuraea africana]
MSAELSGSAELGRICGVAAVCARDLRRCAELYGELFPASPFDAAFFSSLTLVGAFGSPWADADLLKAVNRASLFVTGVDRLFDLVAGSRREVDELVRDCLEVADGAVPGSPITRFLADLRDELATAPHFAGLAAVWHDQLRLMLEAMAREWRWHEGGERPGYGAYLANADSTGSTFVNVSHWIYTGDSWTLARLDELRTTVSAEVQRYLRLLNDLATYRRDVSWGELNVLMLGVGRDEVDERMAALVRSANTQIEAVRDGSPRTALYLERQIGFNTGFYGIADFWGEL